MVGVVWKRTSLRPPAIAVLEAAGMLPTAIWSAGTRAVRSNVAL